MKIIDPRATTLMVIRMPSHHQTIAPVGGDHPQYLLSPLAALFFEGLMNLLNARLIFSCHRGCGGGRRGGGRCVFSTIGAKVRPLAIWRALFLHENIGQKRVEKTGIFENRKPFE